MVLKAKAKALQSPRSYTQYITIPSAMVRDSQYPFKPAQELELVIIPEKGILIIRPAGMKAENTTRMEVKV